MKNVNFTGFYLKCRDYYVNNSFKLQINLIRLKSVLWFLTDLTLIGYKVDPIL